MPLDGGRRVSARVALETLRFPVFPRNVGMLEDGQGRWRLNPPGARGRTRTGMGLPPRDFRTRYGLRRCTLLGPVAGRRAFGVWTLPLPCRIGARRAV